MRCERARKGFALKRESGGMAQPVQCKGLIPLGLRHGDVLRLTGRKLSVTIVLWQEARTIPPKPNLSEALFHRFREVRWAGLENCCRWCALRSDRRRIGRHVRCRDTCGFFPNRLTI